MIQNLVAEGSDLVVKTNCDYWAIPATLVVGIKPKIIRKALMREHIPRLTIKRATSIFHWPIRSPYHTFITLDNSHKNPASTHCLFEYGYTKVPISCVYLKWENLLKWEWEEWFKPVRSRPKFIVVWVNW